MSCERFGTAIAAHAAGAELHPTTARHLSGCAACRRLLDTQAQMLAELDAELGRSLSISASPDFVARVARSARDIDAAPARRWIPAPVWAGLAMAAAMVVAVWVSQPPVADSPRPADVGRTAAAQARREDFRLKAEATQTPQKFTRPQETLTPQGRLTQTQEKPAVGAGSLDPGRPEPARSRTSPPVVVTRRTADVDPPVIIEPERALAIARLRELMAQGRLDEQMLPPLVTPEAALAELSIAPLEVAEIRVPGVEIVGRPAAAPQRQ